jgi:hypothetical protein
MMPDEDQIEMLLRQLQPRAPRPWPARDVRRPLAWAWVAAAAAIAVLAANLRFMPMASLAPDIAGTSGLTVSGMRGLIDADPATLDRALLEASKSVLPDVEAPDSALRPFARP